MAIIACTSSKPAAQTPDSTQVPLTGTYWRLVELRGKETGPTPADKREVYLKLQDNGDAEGFAGCNSFRGKYEATAGGRIRFNNVASTLMACQDMTTEDALLEALKTCDSYNLTDGKLVLNRARMAPLARFEARVNPK